MRVYSKSILLWIVVATILVCIFLFFDSVIRQRSRAIDQLNSIAWVDKVGGFYDYDYQFRNGEIVSRNLDDSLAANPKTNAPEWLVNLIGIDFFQDVIAVRLNYDTAPDLSKLHGFPKLVFLDLSYAKLIDSRPLEKLENLQWVHLGYSDVDDVKPLVGNRNLRFLDVSDSRVTDVGPIGKLVQLEDLCLSGLVIERGLMEIGNLKRLEYLDISDSGVSDNERMELQRMLPQCQIVY